MRPGLNLRSYLTRKDGCASYKAREVKVIIFYSGHGVPDIKTREPYLVPFDADPNYVGATGYALKRSIRI